MQVPNSLELEISDIRMSMGIAIGREVANASA
jgi:hypothetical protein